MFACRINDYTPRKPGPSLSRETVFTGAGSTPGFYKTRGSARVIRYLVEMADGPGNDRTWKIRRASGNHRQGPYTTVPLIMVRKVVAVAGLIPRVSGRARSGKWLIINIRQLKEMSSIIPAWEMSPAGG
jgi:hypothetical protein